MIFWWICGGESGSPVLFLCHLRTASMTPHFIRMFFWFLPSVQLLSRVWLFATPWTAARQASLSITNSRGSLILTSIGLVMPSSHLILYRPLFLLPPIPPSIRVFSSESTLLMRCPKYWSFSFSIILSKEIPGLISFRMDWLDLLAILFSDIQHSDSILSYCILKHWLYALYCTIYPCS